MPSLFPAHTKLLGQVCELRDARSVGRMRYATDPRALS